MSPVFLPGLELSRVLYEDAVRPILDDAFPHLSYAAARVGPGSEVLGFDTARSADHDWGPRLELFLSPDDADAYADDIRHVLAARLPAEVRGWPTHFVHSEDPADPVSFMRAPDGATVDHRVTVHDVPAWTSARLGPMPSEAAPDTLTWLSLPQQHLAELTGGAVFHDGPGDLTALRERLAWYPDQVWRYLLAAQWQRLSQEEAFVGRCAEVGDDLGSAVVAGRLVRDLMRLCLLLERRYAPYAKWLGSAFARLEIAPALTPALRAALAATDPADRERHLCDAYETVAAAYNALGLTAPLDPARRPYHSRPFLVLHAERFAHALAATLTDPVLRALPLTGSVDQWSDSTDLLGHPAAVRAATHALG
ncbi:DUF4037 domain-containing protein [Streptomyces sp. NPDC060194]|uniref:DUF4037 domain-containing protein n=1 Tax=Streptomyces sp. NPDC060194 TaxID=3347069 RepID=UPI0036685944